MTDLKIWINNQLADIGNQEDFNLLIKRQVMDFSNPTGQGGDHTYDVTFPPTKRNELIFGPNLAEVGAVKKFRSIAPVTVEIFADGLRIFRGIVVVKRASRQDGFTVVMYSDDIDWASVIQNKSLRDLQTLADIPFTGSRIYGIPIEPPSPLRQQDIWPLTADDISVCFPLIAYGNYPSLSGLATGLTANNIADIKWIEINPCVYVVHVIRAIFEEVGFSLAGGFFDTAEAKKHGTAYTGDTPPAWNWGLLARANASNTPYTYSADIFPPLFNFDFQLFGAYFWRLVTGTENWDYSDSYFQASPPEQYVVPVSGTYEFNLELGNVTLFKALSGPNAPVTPYDWLRTAVAIVIVPADPSELLALQQSVGEYLSDQTVTVVSNENVIAFYDFGTGYQESPYTLLPFTVGGTYSQIQTGIAGNPGAQLDGTGTVELTISDVQLAQGMRVEFWLISQYALLDPIGNQNYTADAYVIDIRETSFSNELEVAPLLPDMTQFDYVKSVVTAFNLKFSVDPVRRVVRFDTFDNFYRNNQFARNWTALGSDSQTPSRPVPFYQSSVLRWSNDESDALLTRFGASQFQIDQENDSVYAIRSKETIEVSSFSPIYEREYSFRLLLTFAPLNKLIIPCMASDTQLNTPQGEVSWEYNYRPRMIKNIGLVPGYWSYEGGTLSEYPAARFSFDETGGQSLAFGQDAGRLVRGNGVITTTVQNDGLFQAYWRKFFAMRPLAHLQEVVVSMNAQEFSESDPSVPILFHGIHYWVYAYVDAFDPISQGNIRIELLRQV